jgi:hypothetical protein
MATSLPSRLVHGDFFNSLLERFRAKHALVLDTWVDTGSREENASNQKSRPDSTGTLLWTTRTDLFSRCPDVIECQGHFGRTFQTADMSSEGILDSIFRYPVKGLSPEPMTHTLLSVGQTLPADRRYAIENGPSGFDPQAPQYFPKIKFLMLMRNERLATFESRYDETSHVLTIRHHDEEVAQGNLQTAQGRAAIETFFGKTFAKELRGPPKVLFSDGHSFSDVSRKVVSIINLASVADLETLVGQPVHPLRFRGNLYISGWPAWHEFTLTEQTIEIGSAKLKISKRIVRCAAVNVDPVTALRDLDLPHEIMRAFGHDDCGVYAEVVTGGEIAAGDKVKVVNSSA